MTDRKDKGKAMKPPADATHCGGYPIDTPAPDLTAPRQDATLPPPIGYVDQAEYDALAAKLQAAEAERDAALEVLGECMEEIDDYIRQEYPCDHPVHEGYRQRDFSANPARVFLQARKKGGEG